MISLAKRMLIVVAVVVSITDAIVFYHLWKNPEELTIRFVILVINITVIPIAVIFWYWVQKYKMKW
ncbi:MAG: hypothetical protein HYW23_04465 [Candidatus Aenigmarchaeota archaeon]|nr:hypothetical protein [Candidatus Aenigmarchaeota archaeon]